MRISLITKIKRTATCSISILKHYFFTRLPVSNVFVIECITGKNKKWDKAVIFYLSIRQINEISKFRKVKLIGTLL
jgi:hypothetical protein